MRISLAHVEVTSKAKQNVADCLSEGQLARGKYIQQFEELIAEYTGGRYAVAMCNGTVANTVLLHAMKHLYGHEEVTLPVLTFAAQLNAVLTVGLRPKFVDVTPSLQMGTADDNGLIFQASLMGQVANALASDIVDSCETFVRGIAAHSKAVTVSFYATHAIGIGEGGMVITNDEELAKMCRRMIDHGQPLTGDVLDKFRHVVRGYNGKMSNVHAAIGCGQMVVADGVSANRRQVARWYDEMSGGSWGDLLVSPHGYPFACQARATRDAKIRELESKGVEARRVFSVLPFDEQAFAGIPHCGCTYTTHQDYPNARSVADTWLYVPCHQGMGKSDVEYVVEILKPRG